MEAEGPDRAVMGNEMSAKSQLRRIEIELVAAVGRLKDSIARAMNRNRCGRMNIGLVTTQLNSLSHWRVHQRISLKNYLESRR